MSACARAVATEPISKSYCRERPTRLLIAEHPATCRGIAVVLGDSVQICAEVADSTQAIRMATQEQPEVCIVGRDIPGGGLRAVRGICRAAPNAAVIVLAADRDVDDLLECI